MDENKCNWYEDGVNYFTECGSKYFPYIKPHPEIKDSKCPWCNKQINYVEEDEE